MAHLRLEDSKRKLSDPAEIAVYLSRFGIHFQQFHVNEAGNELNEKETLDFYDAALSPIKEKGGYTDADLVDLKPDTPGLDEMLKKFNREHTHSEDEVRFCLSGRGIFHLNPADSEVFAIELEQGDLISIPAGTKHWFNLCQDKRMKVIRLFQDSTGWTPRYSNEKTEEAYEPLCFSMKNKLIDRDAKDPVVKIES